MVHFSAARDRLDTIPGVGKRAAECIIAEIGAQYWRLARRVGQRRAAVAVSHSILVICWHLLTNDCDHQDPGGDWFARRTDTDKRRDHLIRQLHDLGYGVVLTKVA